MKKFDNIPDDIKKKCVSEIITRVDELDGENIGIISAQDIIDIVTANYGPEIYNLALEDSKKLLQSQVAELEYEIDLLRQQS